jgi:hypothetical protein
MQAAFLCALCGFYSQAISVMSLGSAEAMTKADRAWCRSGTCARLIWIDLGIHESHK